jgi:hypothetical protein
MDRNVYIYLRKTQAAFDFQEVVRHLESYGICLEYPGTPYVRVLNEIGEDFEKPRDWLLAELRSAPSLSFLWWIADREDEDICCRVRFERGITILEFDLFCFEHVPLCLDFVFPLLKVYISQDILLGCVIDLQGDAILYVDKCFF